MKLPLLKLHTEWNKGFVLPLTLVICMIMLAISSGISIILAKELYFPRVSRLSQVAYYAADDGMMCALTIDDTYPDPDTGIGIFQYADTPTSQDVLDKINTIRAANSLAPITLNTIKCATSDIFNASITHLTISPFSRTDSQGNPEAGKSTVFSMTMDLGDGTTRCAEVTVNKTAKYRQVISRGFATCSVTSAFRIERAIVSVSQVQ